MLATACADFRGDHQHLVALLKEKTLPKKISRKSFVAVQVLSNLTLSRRRFSKAEIEQLEQSNLLELEAGLFHEQLSSQTGEMEIINLVDPNPTASSNSTDAEIQKKVRFLMQQGQTVPIILIPASDRRT